MKRMTRLAALLLAVLILASGVRVFAGDLWSEEYYRAYDVSGGLSDAEIDVPPSTTVRRLEKSSSFGLGILIQCSNMALIVNRNEILYSGIAL